jgi:hypothetical protein
MTIAKTFHKLLQEVSIDAKKVKKAILTDQRMTQTEKSILNCFLLLRDNKNYEILAELKNSKMQSDDFVESMRQFAIAGALNNLGKYEESLKHFQTSYNRLPKTHDNAHYEFILLNNLFTASLNLQNLKMTELYLNSMNELKDLSELNEIRRVICQFSYSIKTKDEEKSQLLYQHIQQHLTKFLEHDLTSIQLLFFNYGMVYNDFIIAKNALDTLKNFKKYSLTQNYNYMKILFEHITENKPIYIYESDFKYFDRLLSELKLIKALEKNIKEEIKIEWENLKRSSPHAFTNDFKYVGANGIFKICLEKHQANLKIQDEISFKKDPQKSVLENLEAILLTKAHISKEEIYFLLYDKKPETKEDINRISKYIYKLKENKNYQINYKRNLMSIKKAG